MDYPPRSNLTLNEHVKDITYEVLDGFNDWIEGALSKDIYLKIKKTQEIIKSLQLSVILTEKNDGFHLNIKGKNDDKIGPDSTAYLSGPSFTFEKLSNEVWGLGITIDEEPVTLENGEEITLSGVGLARFLPTLMFYLIKNTELVNNDDFNKQGMRIGIDTDASGGFWESMGMEVGRYSIDNPRQRHRSSTGAYTGLEMEFDRGLDSWGDWVYGIKSRGSAAAGSRGSAAAGSRGGRSKKIYKKKNKKKSYRSKNSKRSKKSKKKKSKRSKKK